MPNSNKRKERDETPSSPYARAVAEEAARLAEAARRVEEETARRRQLELLRQRERDARDARANAAANRLRAQEATIRYNARRSILGPRLAGASKSEMVTIFSGLNLLRDGLDNIDLSIIFETLRLRDDWFKDGDDSSAA